MTVNSYNEDPLEMIFDTEGSTLTKVVHKWGEYPARAAKKFAVDGNKISIWIDPDHPKSRKRVYRLELKGGKLEGTLTGLTADRARDFENKVELKPK